MLSWYLKSRKGRALTAVLASALVAELLSSTGGGSAALAQPNVFAHQSGAMVSPAATRKAAAQGVTFKSPAGWQLSPYVGSFRTLYSFKGKPDGAFPLADLIQVGGMLYGTTVFGGSYDWGTVFKISLSGAERVLHSFGSGSDGVRPQSPLVDVGGTLYGTTEFGGTRWGRLGTVFKITPSGAEKVLHSFRGFGDGAQPVAGLIYVNGALYGTTSSGGLDNNGTVFKITPSGTECVIHRFNGSDGAGPQAGLIYVNGALYGTTYGGGASNNGTVFKITPSGAFTLLHTFTGVGDGALPVGGLIYVNGALYGTTRSGGTSLYYGTVFKIASSGAERVIYNFTGNSDGADPHAGLIYVNGALYGTTTQGGASNWGTVFKVTPTGAESVIHRFNGSDGADPEAGLIYVNGALYGTTGPGVSGNPGTVFKISL